VSATPAVGGTDDGDSADRGRRVYFPDWGGKLWKVDAATGEALWSRAIPDYNGIPGSLSRTSPVFGHGMVYVGDLNGNLMAVDAATGDLRWIMELDPHPAAIITASPVVLGDRLYIGVSSNETALASQTPGYRCCMFCGSMLALDTYTGAIVWQSFVLPDNGGQPGGFAGGAFVNPPAIDLEHRLVYGGAGQLYT
jgi:polyvinyl alcohol dehydrogenase (cytochrome)